jgi:hypothetical protein
MQTHRQRKHGRLFWVAVFVASSLFHLSALALQPGASLKEKYLGLAEEGLVVLRGNDGTWHIPDSSGIQGGSASHLGTRDNPLPIYDLKGVAAGEVYQVFSSEGYVGFYVVSYPEKEQKLVSGFLNAGWPLDQAGRELELLDLDNPLVEPGFHLSLDEDRLVLRVNLGNRELELGSLVYEVSEIRTRGPIKRQKKRLLQR